MNAAVASRSRSPSDPAPDDGVLHPIPDNGGTVYLVRAGHYVVSFEHLVMTQDSRDEADPKRLPDDVVRVSMATGVTLDFEGRAAEEMRSHLEVVALRSRSTAMRHAVGSEPRLSDDPGDAAGGGRVAGDGT